MYFLKMLLSVCMASYNTLPLTRACLDSLTKTLGELDIDYEIILVDDLSTDGTREYLQTLSSPFRVIYNNIRLGFAANNNLAIGETRGDILCLLNCDTLLQPGWLQPMLDLVTSKSHAGFVGNVHWSPRTKRYDHMGMVIQKNLIPAHFGKRWRFVPFKGYREWACVTAACCLIKKSVFLEGGGFDESYRNGCEDVDLCFKLGTMGYRHYVTYSSRIWHYVSSSPGRSDQTQKNEDLLLQRWGNDLKDKYTQHEARLCGWNYIGKFADSPWKYNGPKLMTALKQISGIY